MTDHPKFEKDNKSQLGLCTIYADYCKELITMVDVWLIIATIVVSVVLLVCCFYLYVVYCHPQDKGFGSKIYFKIVVISGMYLCAALVLSLPMDVANSRGIGGGLDIQGLAKAIFIIMFAYIVVLLPFSIFLYETDDDKTLVWTSYSVCQDLGGHEAAALHYANPCRSLFLSFRCLQQVKTSCSASSSRFQPGHVVK